uniref:Uncharacterized protein n=1 Tax=viral metagenome TaxID=1070528 RepID=A0A6M3IJJ1_9ZZZZ
MAKKKITGNTEIKPEPVEEINKSGWVKVTQEQLIKLQVEGKVVGYRPATKEALLK